MAKGLWNSCEGHIMENWDWILCGCKPWSVVQRHVLQLGSQINAISISSCAYRRSTQQIIIYPNMNPPFWDGLDTNFDRPGFNFCLMPCRITWHRFLTGSLILLVLRLWYNLTYRDNSFSHHPGCSRPSSVLWITGILFEKRKEKKL